MSLDSTKAFVICADCVADPNGQPVKARPIASPPNARTPRCATHLRQHEKQLKKNARAGAVQRQRGISGEDSHALLIFQGGTCWLCRKATGATKSLAHDHDHKHCAGETSCAECLRGRLCGPCNQFIGRLGDSEEAARRLVGYLRGDTPWRRLVASRWLPVVPEHLIRIDEHGDGSLHAVLSNGAVMNLPSVTEMLAAL
jgi:hypothetical protein